RPDEDLPILDRQPADGRMIALDGVVRGPAVPDRQRHAVLFLDVPAPRVYGSGADPERLGYGVGRLKLSEYGYEFFFATRRSRHRSTSHSTKAGLWRNTCSNPVAIRRICGSLMLQCISWSTPCKTSCSNVSRFWWSHW